MQTRHVRLRQIQTNVPYVQKVVYLSFASLNLHPALRMYFSLKYRLQMDSVWMFTECSPYKRILFATPRLHIRINISIISICLIRIRVQMWTWLYSVLQNATSDIINNFGSFLQFIKSKSETSFNGTSVYIPQLTPPSDSTLLKVSCIIEYFKWRHSVKIQDPSQINFITFGSLSQSLVVVCACFSVYKIEIRDEEKIDFFDLLSIRLALSIIDKKLH